MDDLEVARKIHFTKASEKRFSTGLEELFFFIFVRKKRACNSDPLDLQKFSLSHLIFVHKRVHRFSRTSLPVPGHSEVNLCSVLSLGKDLSKITMPVIFNEPLSFLQRVAEYMEYAKLLKQASEEQSPISRLQVRRTVVLVEPNQRGIIELSNNTNQ